MVVFIKFLEKKEADDYKSLTAKKTVEIRNKIKLQILQVDWNVFGVF